MIDTLVSKSIEYSSLEPLLVPSTCNCDRFGDLNMLRLCMSIVQVIYMNIYIMYEVLWETLSNTQGRADIQNPNKHISKVRLRLGSCIAVQFVYALPFRLRYSSSSAAIWASTLAPLDGSLPCILAFILSVVVIESGDEHLQEVSGLLSIKLFLCHR